MTNNISLHAYVIILYNHDYSLKAQAQLFNF